MNSRNFFAELKRRNVYKVAIAYLVGGWALSQGLAQVLPVFEVPNWVVRLVILLIVIGFPVAVVLAWVFEMTPEGIKRTEQVTPADERAPKKYTWVYVVVVGAMLSIALFFIGRYTARTSLTPRSSNVAAVEAKSIDFTLTAHYPPLNANKAGIRHS